jgi:hypothetical protein
VISDYNLKSAVYPLPPKGGLIKVYEQKVPFRGFRGEKE